MKIKKLNCGVYNVAQSPMGLSKTAAAWKLNAIYFHLFTFDFL